MTKDDRRRTDGHSSAVILVHDSAESGPEEQAHYRRLADLVAQRLDTPVHVSALAGGATALAPTIQACIANGDQQVVALPLALGAANPQLSDIAGAIVWARSQWPERLFLGGGPLATAEHLRGALAQRASKALAHAAPSISAPMTALLVVAPGSEDAYANAEIFQIGRLLWEGRDYGWVECAFVGLAEPDITAGLLRCTRLGARRTVVLPLTLFAGQTYARIAAQVQAARAELPALDILLAQPLATLASLMAVVMQRYAEASAGAPTSPPPARCPRVGAQASWGGHRHTDEPPIWAMLPPRYRDGHAVSAAPMGAAPLRYDTEGNVAWDELWTDFCELALAGGPPHRGNLLEPVPPDAVRAQPQAYARVLAELARGLRLVTGLPIVRDAAPGWIGLVCDSEDMALWLLRAMVVENMCVRREGATLFFPAGPDFRLECEIKNVITVVAKTYHYWTEHQSASRRWSTVIGA